MPRLFRALTRACIFSRRAHQQEAKETAMRDIPAPSGFRRCTVPGKTGTGFIVYDHGVRFEQDCSEPDPKKQRWFCACLSGNQDNIPIEVPALSSEQALQAVPRRLSNLRQRRRPFLQAKRRTATATSTKGKAQASRRCLGDKWGQRRIFCVL